MDNDQMMQFQCKCDDCAGDPFVQPDIALRIMVRQVERYFRPAKMRIHSGYRCPAHNIAIGGSRKSHHVRAQAIDFSIPGVELHDIYRWLDNSPYRCGLGIYNSHIHLDSRDGEARWDYRTRGNT